MADRARRIDPVSLEEFQVMDFGRRKAELIDGIVTVAQAFPTSRHADITVGVVVAFANAISAGSVCLAGSRPAPACRSDSTVIFI